MVTAGGQMNRARSASSIPPVPARVGMDLPRAAAPVAG
jgi:hypothetical protein